MISFEAGDIVWTDLDPVFGTEQGGRRPVLVVSDRAFNANDQRSIICPISRNLSPWPTKILLPDGMKTIGAVLVDQIRCVHRDSRRFRLIEKAPEPVLASVRNILGALLGIEN